MVLVKQRPQRKKWRSLLQALQVILAAADRAAERPDESSPKVRVQLWGLWGNGHGLSNILWKVLEELTVCSLTCRLKTRRIVWWQVVGPVTQVAGKGPHYKLRQLFGVTFFAAGYGADVLQHEVVVPAWSSRTVSKADQACSQPPNLPAQRRSPCLTWT